MLLLSHAEEVRRVAQLRLHFLLAIPAVRKVDVRLSGKGNPNSHGARPVRQIISMIKWTRTSGFILQYLRLIDSGLVG